MAVEHPESCNRNREQGRLSILGKLERFGWAFEAKLGEGTPKSAISFVENLTRFRITSSETLAHPHVLGALSRKDKCGFHKEPNISV